MGKLDGKKALVTGSSRGIGLGTATALLAEGCEVVLNSYCDTEKAEAEVQRLRGLGYRVSHIDANVGDPIPARAMVREAAARMGGLDIVHSNAGICHFMPFLEISDAEWRLHQATNYDAGFFVGQEAAKIMVERGRGGRIIFTTSTGAFRSNQTQTHYCATKGGLHLLALGMALELGAYGITVNCLAPGWIHTDINDAASRDTAVVGPWLQWNAAIPRLGRPQDCGGTVAFLASDDAAYVTGCTIFVDGGWNAKL